MKKGEKPPEMEAFERAFGRGAQGMPDAGAGRDVNASRPLANPSTFRQQPTPPAGIKRQTTPPGGMRAPGPASSFPPRAAGHSPLSPQGRPAGVSGASQSLGRVASTTREWGSGIEEEEDFDDEEEASEPTPRGRVAARPAPVVRDGFSTGLVRVVLLLVALFAAYSLQSHSQKNYAYTAQQSVSAPGTAVGIIALSYDAGWPLPYAHVALTNLSLGNLSPTPTLHDMQPAPLLVDVLFLAVPLWIVLEAVWMFWALVLSRFGPRKPLRRFIAVGFTGLPATLWIVGGLALGGFLSATSAPGKLDPSTWPKVAWLALAPAIPGFNLASAVSSVLAIPPNLWWQDFGIFLLVMGLPIALLTACLYVFFCLIGRALRRSGGQRAGA